MNKRELLIKLLKTAYAVSFFANFKGKNLICHIVWKDRWYFFEVLYNELINVYNKKIFGKI